MKSICVVIGPTASGKSDRAVELALEIGGEVINADSRQVYKGLDVGTGKMTEQEMRGVKHHLLSYVEVGELYSVSKWIKDARSVIDDILSRGKVPIVCGGTGMYIYSLIYGLDHDVAPNYELRNRLNQLNTAELFNKYKEAYKIFYKQDLNLLDKSISNNRPRLIRSIEIFENSKSKNTKENLNKSRQPLYDVKYIRMEKTKEQLRERITRRAEQRMDAIIDEVNILLTQGVDPDWLSRVGIEYGIILSQIQAPLPASPPNGEEEYIHAEVVPFPWGRARDGIIPLIVLRSLQYAKRQNTWNKKYFQA